MDGTQEVWFGPGTEFFCMLCRRQVPETEIPAHQDGECDEAENEGKQEEEDIVRFARETIRTGEGQGIGRGAVLYSPVKGVTSDGGRTQPAAEDNSKIVGGRRTLVFYKGCDFQCSNCGYVVNPLYIQSHMDKECSSQRNASYHLFSFQIRKELGLRYGVAIRLGSASVHLFNKHTTFKCGCCGEFPVNVQDVNAHNLGLCGLIGSTVVTRKPEEVGDVEEDEWTGPVETYVGYRDMWHIQTELNKYGGPRWSAIKPAKIMNFLLVGDTRVPGDSSPTTKRYFDYIGIRDDKLLEAGLALNYCGRCCGWRYHTADKCTLLEEKGTQRLLNDVCMGKLELKELYNDFYKYCVSERFPFPMCSDSFSIVGDLDQPKYGEKPGRLFMMIYKRCRWSAEQQKGVVEEKETTLTLFYCAVCDKWRHHHSGECRKEAPHKILPIPYI